MPRAKIASAQIRVPALLGALMLVVTACASTSPPPSDPRLAGHWKLDPAASDNVAQRVSQFVARAQTKYHARARAIYGDAAGPAEGGGSGGPRGGGDSGAGTEDLSVPLAPDFGGISLRVQQTLSAPSTLTIETSGDDVRLQPDALPGRDYHVGETLSHFDEYGAATITTRWAGIAFELRARYTSHATFNERYQTDPKTGALTYTRTLQDPQLGKIELHSLYRRQ